MPRNRKVPPTLDSPPGLRPVPVEPKDPPPPAPLAMELPAVRLIGVNFEVQDVDGQKSLVLGPVALVIPFDESGRKKLIQMMTGITLATPTDVPPTG